MEMPPATNMTIPVQRGGDCRVIEKQKATLEEACRQVEGLFIGMLMKESIKAEMDSEEADVGNTGALLEAAIEKVAQDIGDKGGFGFSDAIYEQLSQDR
jgi:Rod binding domain-containing protein